MSPARLSGALLRVGLTIIALALAVTASASGRGAAAGGALSYVALGDSIAVWNVDQSYPAVFGMRMASDVKVVVNTQNLGVGGMASGGLLAALRGNDAFRASVASADVITWNIGINDLWAARSAHKAGTCGGADNQDCLRAALDTFDANYPQIIDEVRALNTKPLVMLRAVDVYNPFIAPDTADGSLTALKPYFDAMNAHIATDAAAAGIPVARVSLTFNGASGTEDPGAKGYLVDGLHPTVAGSAAMAATLRALLYEPIAHDSDGDGIVDVSDNCPTAANAGQENHDANFLDLSSYGKLYNDTTWPNSDTLGDACDTDADNDGLPNDVETSLPGPACPSATGPTSPLKRDTDGDLVLDGAECLLGTDPANAASKPPSVVPGDSDHDGLSDAVELALGTDPLKPDTDGDRLLDGVEVKGYNTDPLRVNTDGDACADGKEAASINTDTTVNSTDLWQVAVSYASSLSSKYVPDMDVNKDGNVNSTDMAIASRLWGYCR